MAGKNDSEQINDLEQEVFRLQNVNKVFYSGGVLSGKNKSKTQALRDVSFSVYKGETLGIVGESGSGKSTLGKILLHIETASSGKVEYNLNGKMTDVSKLSKQEARQFTQQVQMVFQDPYSSLNPMKRIIDSMDLALRTFERDRARRLENIAAQIERVNLPAEVLYKYPHELSGGQKQRINIARVLSLNPQVIVFDEATSSLDVSVQATVINLIKDIQKELNLTYLFITHDLSVVDYVSDRTLVFYKGEIVEELTDDIISSAKHPYTKKLLDAVPKVTR